MALRYAPVVLLLCLAACGSAPRAEHGPQLYLAGDGELWIVDADSQRVRRELRPELQEGDTPHRILARGHRLLTSSAFGDWSFVLPSARPDRLWVVDLQPGTAFVAAVREVTVDGRTTVPPTAVPGRKWPLGAVNDGLLLEAGNGVDVWNPASGLVVHHLREANGIIGAATGDVVTGCSDVWCGNLRLIDVDSGAERLVPAPDGLQFEPWTGTFSPSGGLLALALREPGQSAAEHRRLALVDMASGRLAVIP